jgi:hypothetical protein
MRFLVIELDGARLDRVQHRLQGLVGKREATTAAPRTPALRRWVRSWDPAQLVRQVPSA